MNHLKNQKSPYLLQHAENPVHWYAWTKEALEKAVLEQKPIFLSIGYSTCHWCHVMAHESFEDEEVAEILNQSFISIKVDREERPDIDAVYMAACQAMTGNGGWPLTLFLTPDQKPFLAGTYFPKRRRYGQPGLIEILLRVRQLWEEQREQLLETGQQITAFLSRQEAIQFGVPDQSLLKQAFAFFQHQYDPKFGGFGAAPKFPVPHHLFFLLRYFLLEKETDALEMAEHTLIAMASGGIHDQIGGGFSRYSTDEKWLVPHFEKMLYDNALLAIAYLEAYQITKKTYYAEVAKGVLDYILRELTGENGELFCGQDADSEGEEGKYYIFTPEEVLNVLGKSEGEAFCREYQITEHGNFEGKSIPNRIGKELERDKVWKFDDERIQKLYHYRRQRTQLHRDDKVILSWNAWAILAMAKAAQILEEERLQKKYQDAAKKAHCFIATHMTDPQNRLFLRWREESAHSGQLDDYAVYGIALLELYRTTFQPQYLQESVFRAKQMVELFESEEGGYYLTANDAEALITRPKEVYDGALPSGNTAAAVLLIQLANYTGESIWQEAAERQIAFLTPFLREYPLGYSFGLVALLHALYPSEEFICVTQKLEEDQIPKPFKDYLQKEVNPNRTVLLKTEAYAAQLGQVVPFTKNYPISQNDTVYYLCQNGKCEKPETDITKLKSLK